MADIMHLNMLWTGNQVLSSGEDVGTPVRIFDKGQPSVQWYVQVCPLQERWVALRSLFHGGCYTTTAQGVLTTQSVSDAELQTPAGLDAYGFTFVTKGDDVLLMNRAKHLVRSDGAGGFILSSNGMPTTFKVQDYTLSEDTFNDQLNACQQVDAGALKPRWEDIGHHRLVQSAFDLVKTHSSIRGADRPRRLFENSDFKNAIFQGLYDADYLDPYKDTVAIIPNILGIPTYKSHFFDPSTGKNWRGDTKPTALTQAIFYANLSLKAATGRSDGQKINERYKEAGYYLGLALHYVTDLSQPMHAANFINWPISPCPDWRHSGFEKVAEATIGSYILTPSTVRADQINPDALDCKDMHNVVIELARKQKSVYDTQLKPLLDSKVHVIRTPLDARIYFSSEFTVEECDPIFRTALRTGQLYCGAFLLAWGREGFYNTGSIAQITDLLLSQ